MVLFSSHFQHIFNNVLVPFPSPGGLVFPFCALAFCLGCVCSFSGPSLRPCSVCRCCLFCFVAPCSLLFSCLFLFCSPCFPLFFAVSNLGDSQLSVSPVGTCFFSCLRPLDHRPCGSHDLTFVKSPFGSRLRSRAGVSNAPVAGEYP